MDLLKAHQGVNQSLLKRIARRDITLLQKYHNRLVSKVKQVEKMILEVEVELEELNLPKAE